MVSFKGVLNRLTNKANNPERGYPPNIARVNRDDLRNLLYHFDRVDKELRQLMGRETVVIPWSEYRELLKDKEFLSCLQAAGVDNWQGYSDAQDMMEEED